MPSTPGVFRPLLARLLVLLLVPVLVLANPTTASAATVNGPRADWTFGFDSAIPGQSMSCLTANYWQADATTQTVNGSASGCTLGYITGNAWDLIITAYGVTVDGEVCGGSWSGDEVNVEGSFTYSMSTDYGCLVDQMCVTAIHDDYADDKEFEDCASVAIGGPEAQAIDCAQAAPHMPVVGARFVTGASTFRYQRVTTFGFTRNPVGPSDQWRYYVVRRDSSTGALTFAFLNASVGPTFSHTIQVTTTTNATTWSSGPGNGVETWPIIGFGVARSSSASAWQYLPQNNASGLYGVTDVPNCMWYWGDKIATTSDERDEPFGPATGSTGPVGTVDPPDTTTPPPTQQTSRCGFSIRDPSTWTGSVMCALMEGFGALAEVLERLITAVVDLAGEIVSGIVDGIKDLFVPDGAVIDQTLGEVREAWGEVGPGGWLTAIKDAGLGMTAGGGCDGPHVDVNFSFAGQPQMGFDSYPLRSCSGTASTLAGASRLLLSCWIGWFGGMACVRAIGSGFNWSPGGGGS